MASRGIDLVIGIDVGMSGTAVAYSNLAKHNYLNAPIMKFQNWENTDEEGKVPTQLIYDRANIDKGPIAWGFTRRDQPEYPSNHVYAKWFKVNFCKSSQAANRQQQPDEDILPPVDIRYVHFLSKLYCRLEKVLNTKELKPLNKTWNHASIEFIFSFPAGWDRFIVNRFKGLAEKAGFGCHQKHRVTAPLSEPEAVAIFSARVDRISLGDDNNVLVVDAGGGTIDICLVKTNVSANKDIQLRELEPNTGEDSGSTYIDQQFVTLASKELEKASHEQLGGEPGDLAWRMMNGEEFQNHKHTCAVSYADDDIFLVKIPKLDRKFSFEEANIMDGELRVKWGQLKSMFDYQINDMVGNVEAMVIDARRVDHIILSGGLGSSPYVQKQLQDRLRQHPSFRDASFHVSSEPQFCVCKGLVYECVRKLYNGLPTFTKLCSQNSYGIIKYEEYNYLNQSHRLAKKENGVEISPLDGKRFVGYIDWLIRKGDEMKPGDKITKQLRRRFGTNVKDFNLVGDLRLVGSSKRVPPNFLTQDNGVQILDSIRCNYSDLKIRSGLWHIFLRGGYQEVRFKLQTTMEGQGVTFECLSPDGIPISSAPLTVPVLNTPVESSIPFSLVMSD
ncbi:hypothetical protein F4814DRAFT_427049 [Daldinia grandis]|nr:hypothetical protein F4814DRAFT_427049 [Daldinia grandis]